MKVLFGLKVPPELQEIYREKLSGKNELIFPTEVSEEILLEYATSSEIFVAYKLSKAFMEKANILKHIQVPWTGSETLDFDLLAHYPQVTVSNSHSNSLAIAEHAISLLLSAAKRITYRDSHMRKGDWNPRYNDENSYWITGKTLGVIGLGAIGKKVAKILRNGFNMSSGMGFWKDLESNQTIKEYSQTVTIIAEATEQVRFDIDQTTNPNNS